MNVLFIQSDQHARQFTGCYGDIVRTPHIDWIAQDGVRFDRASCCSPICAPTRASLFAGRPVHELGVWDNASAYDGRPEGWPHYLRDKGIPLTTIGRLDFRRGADHGIDDMRLEAMRDSDDVIALFRQQPTVQRRACYYEYFDICPRRPGSAPDEVENEASDTAITEEAVKWLRRERPAGRPWVLYVGYALPHPKWHPEKELFDRYLKDAPALGAKYLQPIEDLHPFDQRNAVYTCAYENEGPHEIAIMHAAYRAVIEEFDRQVGQVLQTLRDEKLVEDTLIIYASDHGESARAHGNVGKSSMYEESVGIPLVIRGPGLKAGTHATSVVSHLDLFPTIAEALGLGPPGFSRGRSLLPLARGAKDPDPQRPGLIEYHASNAPSGVFAIRQGPWKFIEYLGERPALYNLDDDPDEMHDLVLHEPGETSTKQQVERMRHVLHSICDPERVDAQAKRDQGRRKAELLRAGTLAHEVYQRGYERNTEALIPWDWARFEALYH